MEQHRAPAQVRAAVGRSARSGAPDPTPGTGSLGDAALADEIELYGAVVVAASEKDGSLTDAEIDAALGVPSVRRGGSRTAEADDRSG
ncbi:hypothetical protein WDZ16_14495 [Pseudokineococcus marinus]|uniref:Uncharacterized protein n=1 Tax=Pseudokineococcus marinus TaxID=351215 RepID=A0A849BNJ2_9ACTN|nr:hypothetical protein [Pseudokineococcus marinus]NNH22913.1 hypothetical protein [Pseudokineococcus marinus]